jgi:hypothetical protein
MLKMVVPSRKSQNDIVTVAGRYLCLARPLRLETDTAGLTLDEFHEASATAS